MADISRRKLLLAGGAIGAMGALNVVSPVHAWTWNSLGSIAATDSVRDPRFVWDDQVDPVIASLLDRGGVPAVNATLKPWVYNGQRVPSGLPADVQGIVDMARTLPSWADLRKLDIAYRFATKRGLYLGVLYGMNSGMMSAAIPREARAVYWSKGGADIRDRIAKTAKLGYDIGAYHAYRPDGKMIVTCVKTRLTHSAVRHLLPQSSHWRASADEQIPISQYDILVTWHSLASSVMQKLDEWGVRIPSDERDAYLHLWQVTASMLGVDDEYIPVSWEQAEQQRQQVLVPLLARTDEGVKLADMLVNLGEYIDFTLVTQPIFEAVTRYMLGDTVTDMLELTRRPILEKTVEEAWPIFVRIREAGLPIPLAPTIYSAFEELIRLFALFYLNPFQQINIDIPTGNNPDYEH
ncbi:MULTISPECIES: oxygenase MpaB family protein [Microbacterium]|uniref:oxygenase MpaB family protein n=1 Tax=Microbacterium TaxID=33882 RepID=UPI000D64DDC4|nr:MULTISPECIES: oxygenase MpaB family protein [Microbacterium]